MQNDDRDTHGCCYTTVVHYLSAAVESKCDLGVKISPSLAHLNHLLPNMNHWRALRRAAWLHIPTMRLHKKHQLSRTGHLILKHLSMQLLCPVLLSSVCIGRGGYSVVSVAVELQGHAGQLVGFWLQDLCVRRTKGWMAVIMCNIPICLHVIWKPWINNFI